MRLPLVLLLASAAILPAADEAYRIARWGNALVVTAPGGPGPSRAVSARMNQRLTLDFRDAPFADVVDFLRSASQLNIVVAPAVTLAAPSITLKASDMSLGNVLHWLTKLSGTHLAFINGALFISDQEVAEASVTRIYDISDLTLARRDQPGPELALSAGGQGAGGQGGALFKPAEEAASGAPTSDEIADLIKQVVAPGKWDR